MDTSPLLFCLLFSVLLSSLKPTADGTLNTAKKDNQVIAVVGAIVDETCRTGKEAKVAMKMAIEDVYNSTNQTLDLHVINFEKSNPSHAVFAAKDLINTNKVQAIVGPHTWEEAQLVADIASQACIPVLCLAGATPPWAEEQWPFLVQAAPNNFIQMKAIAAIIDSWEWHRVTVIYEDTESSTAGIIPHLYDALQESGVEIASLLPLPPFVSSSSMTKQLERIKNGQCRVILVHLSLPLATKLFERAKEMEMMQKDYVWITTDTFTNNVHSISASSISSMQNIIGVKSYFPENEPGFQDFHKRFRKTFGLEFPDEDNHEPGINAVQVYDAVWAVGLAMTERNHQEGGQKLLDKILAGKFQGLSGKIEFIGKKLAPMHTFQIINVVGRSYRPLGFWSDAFGFSENIDGKGGNSSSMKSLGPVLWPGCPLTTPRGWAVSTESHPLRIGVPIQTAFAEFLTVVYNGSKNDYTYGGYAIDLFETTVQNLPYYLPYKFFPFNGSYDELVRQIYLKRFDAVVGDVGMVSSRLEYAEFTHPYTEPGLVMVVPVRTIKCNKPWLFVMPFTKGMWVLTAGITIYNGFVVWLIERSHCSELRGSALNQIGTLIWLSFSTYFPSQGEKLHSNLSRMAMAVWLFVALVITQTYTASLTNILTVQTLEPTLTNIEILQRSNAMVGYRRGSYLSRYLVDVLHFNSKNVIQYSSESEYAQALRTGEIAAAFLEASLAKLFIAKHCKEFTIAGPNYKIGGFGFAFPKGSQLIPDINKALLNVSESGMLREAENKMLEREKCKEEEKLFDGSHGDVSSISYTSYRALFIVSAGTSTVALLLYVVHCCQKIEDTTFGQKATWKLMSDVFNRCGLQRKCLARKESNVEAMPTNNLPITVV